MQSYTIGKPATEVRGILKEDIHKNEVATLVAERTGIAYEDIRIHTSDIFPIKSLGMYEIHGDVSSLEFSFKLWVVHQDEFSGTLPDKIDVNENFWLNCPHCDGMVKIKLEVS